MFHFYSSSWGFPNSGTHWMRNWFVSSADVCSDNSGFFLFRLGTCSKTRCTYESITCEKKIDHYLLWYPPVNIICRRQSLRKAKKTRIWMKSLSGLWDENRWIHDATILSFLFHYRHLKALLGNFPLNETVTELPRNFIRVRTHSWSNCCSINTMLCFFFL